MYTISNGPSKIVAKTRRGLHQNYQKFEKINENTSKRSSNNNSPNSPKSLNNNPRPTFQPIRKPNHHCAKVEESVITPQHEELIKYVSDSWNMVLASNPYDANPETVATNGHQNHHNIITTTTIGLKVATSDANNNNKSTTGAYTKSSVSTNGNSDEVELISSSSLLYGESMTTTTTMPWPAIAPLPMSSPYVYQEPQSATLSDTFKPFDLEAWWGRRLFNNITQDT